MNNRTVVGRKPDYSRENVVLTLINPTMTNANGKSTHYRQFAIRLDNTFTDDAGVDHERQPLDFYCTTWQPECIKLLDSLDVGDRVSVTGYLESTWRIYVADGTPSGAREIVPDLGQPERTLDVNGEQWTIYPTAHPYRLDAQQPGVHIYPDKGLNVITLVPATTVKAAESVDASAGNSFAQLQQQQDSLNQATESGEQPPANGQTVPFGG